MARKTLTQYCCCTEASQASPSCRGGPRPFPTPPSYRQYWPEWAAFDLIITIKPAFGHHTASGDPSSQPSGAPSLSTMPMPHPSGQPLVSGQLSSQPSMSPLSTGIPSLMPSESPSVSAQPSSSSMPSKNPSISVVSHPASQVQAPHRMKRRAHSRFGGL